MSDTAAAQRKGGKTLRENLEKTLEQDKFMSIRENREGKLASSKVFITGRKTMWEKHPDFAYSFATRLAGHPDDVVEWLKQAGMAGDDTAADIQDAYEADVLINKANSDDTAPVSIKGLNGRTVRGGSIAGVLEAATAGRVAARDATREEAKNAKENMIDVYMLHDLWDALRKAQGDAPTARRSSGRQAAAVKVTALLAEIEKDPDVYYNVTKFTDDGHGQRRVKKDKIPGTAVKLGSGELSHFVAQKDTGHKGVVAFLTLYNIQKTPGTNVADAAAAAKEQAKEIAPSRRGGASPARRSASKSRSTSRGASSRSSSKSRRSSTSKKSKAPAKKVAAKRAASPKRTASAKPASKRAASPKRTQTTRKTPQSSSSSAPRSPRSPTRSSPTRSSPARSRASPTSTSPPRTATRTGRFTRPARK